MKGNHLRECGNDGIYAFDSAIDVRENLVELSDQKGILISDCRLFMVYDNVVRANGISGIVVGSQGLKDSVGWLGDNDITGNGRNGLYVASNSTCVMYGSNFEGNGWYGVYCQKGGTLEWTVSGTSRVINETLRVRGTVEVARGGTLVVVNSTLHFDHHPEYSWGSVLVSGGEMRVTEGSEVTKGTDLLLEDRDVRLTVRDGGSLNGSGSYFMSSLVIVNEGRFEAYACEFSTENRSISIDGQETYLRLDGCTFTDGASGVVANGADVLIVRCDFLRMSEGIRLVDCNGPGPTVRDTSMFSVRAGLVLEGSYGVNVDNCTFTICQDAILATDVNLLRITNSTISKGTGHGIRSIDSSVHVTDCVLSECAAGAIVHDTNLLWVEGTTIANNQRVGIWANMTELVLVNTSVTNTFGIGVRNSYNPAGQGQDDFFARDSFFQGSAAYDLRLEGAFLARVYNSKLEPDAVRIMDDVVLEVYNPWILRVVVE
ncbi:MAG: hypothetical protein GWN18_02190, partial [Thermoplasmata archaeon]|nr:right-handed parallel beta-helix repeat-containing protein [Thermoplasmata archaeon]NIS10820.1 right-handed parallel beta-helix repeat-containing protein [Thermoplasmata archaeon]NIS18757.1 right-handed parallel beta-helix repeat-containing protein [Thermoplasmata archaeon]NIT75777.1 right-handed parallel beta-helix repeat-containing protein [Thermoplasmata archaeon]NIU47919.1 right-handed parallel beta-helix repeat-containing protein [Thermoplasmata archaeon]